MKFQMVYAYPKKVILAVIVGITFLAVYIWFKVDRQDAIAVFLTIYTKMFGHNEPGPPEDWDSKLAELSWINFKSGERQGNYRALGHNVLAYNCDDYSVSGLDTLASDLNAAFARGFSCLRGASKSRRHDAARLLGFLDEERSSRPVKIFCTHRGETLPEDAGTLLSLPLSASGMALHPLDSGFPGLVLPTDGSSTTKDYRARRETLFHEFLHLLGYYHGESFDLTSLISICCFDEGTWHDDETLAKKIACQMLDKEMDWLSEEYHLDFTNVMRLAASQRVARNAAWTASRHVGPLPILAFAANSSFETRPIGSQVLGLAALKIAPDLKDSESGKVFSEPERQDNFLSFSKSREYRLTLVPIFVDFVASEIERASGDASKIYAERLAPAVAEFCEELSENDVEEFAGLLILRDLELSRSAWIGRLETMRKHCRIIAASMR